MTLIGTRLRDAHRGVAVEALADGYAYEGDHAYLLSVVGADAAVKAITSGLLLGLHAALDGGAELTVDPQRDYRVLSAKLPCGGLHQILIVESLLDPMNEEAACCLIPRDQESAAVLFEFIHRRHSTPLLREWADWLYHRLEAEGCLSRLAGTIPVVRLWLTTTQLNDMVSAGLKSGELTIGDADGTDRNRR